MKIRTILGILLIVALIACSTGVVAAENGYGDQAMDQDRDCDQDRDRDQNRDQDRDRV